MNILDPIFLSHVDLRFSPSDLPEEIVLIEKRLGYMLQAC
jgi:hypothetical protein